jgi:glycerol-3-phosphate acyltransferase PlsX
VIAMGESPAQALRSKPDNSISRSILAVKEGAAGAALSMGNTGACVGAATLLLGTLEGVRRPGIAVAMGLAGKPLALIDMGANIAPKPSDLYQYAVMGSVLAERTLGVARPRVALLNVGEEPGKGTDLLKEAFGLLETGGLCFVGNVEGRDLFLDKADVIVTDGFTGNVVLKLTEELAGFMLRLVVKELKLHQAAWANEALADIQEQIDYAQYGGALLLGVRGIVVIGHGRSDEVAVANALWQAARALDSGVNASIVAGLGAVRAG